LCYSISIRTTIMAWKHDLIMAIRAVSNPIMEYSDNGPQWRCHSYLIVELPLLGRFPFSPHFTGRLCARLWPDARCASGTAGASRPSSRRCSRRDTQHTYPKINRHPPELVPPRVPWSRVLWFRPPNPGPVAGVPQSPCWVAAEGTPRTVVEPACLKERAGRSRKQVVPAALGMKA